MCWGWLVALCKLAQNSDSEFSVRRLTLVCRGWVSPDKKRESTQRPTITNKPYHSHASNSNTAAYTQLAGVVICDTTHNASTMNHTQSNPICAT